MLAACDIANTTSNEQCAEQKKAKPEREREKNKQTITF